jgi:hypothetical protein
MKKFLILILICFAQNTFSQATKKDDILTIDEPIKTTPPQGAIPNDDNLIYNTAGVQVKPEFPGGPEAFDRFIKENFKNPTAKGKVYAMFVVEKDGSLSGIKVIRDIGYETGAEAIRVLKISPKWIPGKNNNKFVRVLYSIPISVNQ